MTRDEWKAADRWRRIVEKKLHAACLDHLAVTRDLIAYGAALLETDPTKPKVEQFVRHRLEDVVNPPVLLHPIHCVALHPDPAYCVPTFEFSEVQDRTKWT